MSLESYQVTLSNLIEKISMEQIRSAAEMIRDTKGIVYIIGNGGSASNAEHFANDLIKVGRIRAIALTAIAQVTAYSNDEGYESSFAGPLYELMAADDILIALTVSGTSQNIITALEYTQFRDIPTIIMTGMHNGKYGDCHIEVRDKNFGRVETVHQAICHMIADTVKEMN